MNLTRSMHLNINNIKKNFSELCNCKYYILSVGLTAFFSYGYLIFHSSIGVDDTALKLYFEDGLAPQIGRNTLYLINKIFRLSDFSPVIIDFLGVLFMIIAATLLCAVFQECSHNKIESWMCTIFTCTMISFSLISEVYIYYLHNGIGIGYLFTIMAVIALWADMGNYIIRMFISGLCLLFAITCYESFVVVFLLITFLNYWFMTQNSAEQLREIKNYIINIISLVFPIIIAVLGRAVLTYLINGNKKPIKDFSINSFSSILWIFKGNLLEQIKTIVGDVIINYGIHSVVISSLKYFNLILLAFLVFLVIKIVERKSIVFFINSIAIVSVPWLFLIIEGRVTQYRQMQAMNILEAFMLMILCYEICKNKNSLYLLRKSCTIILAIIIIYNQSYEQNRYYYIDHLKYIEDKTRMDNIMMELYKNFDESKPLCFIAEENRKISGVMKEYVYYDETAPEYIKMNKRALNIGLQLDKNEEGYSPFQTLKNEVTIWAIGAWGESLQLKEFYAMHGYEISLGTEEMYKEAIKLNENMCAWPKENSIKDMGEFIVIKL